MNISNFTPLAEDAFPVGERLNMELADKIQFYIHGCVGTFICLAGLLGNAVSMHILSLQSMRSSTSVYLTGLALADSVILVIFFTCFSLPYLVDNKTRIYFGHDSFIARVSYPLGLSAHTAAVYITICFTVERCIATRFPLKVQRWCSIPQAKRNVLLVLVLSVVYNIPRAVESIYQQQQQSTQSNNNSTATIISTTITTTVAAATAVQQGLMQFLYHHVYKAYLYVIFMFVLPMAALLALNILLLLTLRKAGRFRNRIGRENHHALSGAQTISSQRRAWKRAENNRTVTVACLVAIFLICQVLAMIDNILVVFLPANLLSALPSRVLFIMGQLLVTVNSAVNFIIYCCVATRFRACLREHYFPCCRAPPPPSVGGLKTKVTSIDNIPDCMHLSSRQEVELCPLKG